MRKIYDDVAIAGLIIIFVFVLSFAGIKALLLNEETRTLRNIIVSVCVGIPCGMLAGVLALDMGLRQGTAIFFASIATIIGEQLIKSLMNLEIKWAELINHALKNLINKWTK